MRSRLLPVLAFSLGSLTIAASALASSIPVTNASFEILPPGGLTLTAGCIGSPCVYSFAPIPGWTNAGATSGQWQVSPPVNTNFFDSVPDGDVVGFSNGEQISQLIGNAVAGVTYTLQVDLGNRKEQSFQGSASLVFASGSYTAIGLVPVEGAWGTFTATHLATALDAGNPFSIVLSSGGVQGNYDNVRLSDDIGINLNAAAVPEPATLGLLGIGLLAIGRKLRRARS